MPIKQQERVASARAKPKKIAQLANRDVFDITGLMFDHTDDDVVATTCLTCDKGILTDDICARALPAFCEVCSQALEFKLPQAM